MGWDRQRMEGSIQQLRKNCRDDLERESKPDFRDTSIICQDTGTMLHRTKFQCLRRKKRDNSGVLFFCHRLLGSSSSKFDISDRSHSTTSQPKQSLHIAICSVSNNSRNIISSRLTCDPETLLRWRAVAVGEVGVELERREC